MSCHNVPVTTLSLWPLFIPVHKLAGTQTGASEFLAKALHHDMYIMGNNGNKCKPSTTKYINNTSKTASNKWRNGSKDLFYLYIFAVLPSSSGMAISGAVVG